MENFNDQSIEVDGAIRITLKGNNKITQKIKATGGKVIIAGDGTLTVDHQQKTTTPVSFSDGLQVESGKLVVTNANFQSDIEGEYTVLSVNNGLEVGAGATNVLSRSITVSAGRTCPRSGAPNAGYRPAQISAVAVVAGLVSLVGVAIAVKKRA